MSEAHSLRATAGAEALLLGIRSVCLAASLLAYSTAAVSQESARTLETSPQHPEPQNPVQQNPAPNQRVLGQQIYTAWCVGCHGTGPGRYGTGLTGTAALEAKYNGKLPAVLDERKDLTPTLVKYFVRHGASVMPFFRKTEISDADLDALAAYLSRLNPKQTREP